MAPIHIKVQTSQGGVLRTVRQVTTTVPSGRTALLRIPIDWLCYDQDNASSDTLSQYGCTATTTCVAGECADADLDSTALPDYAPEDVFGGGAADGGGSCFDTLKCFAEGVSAKVDLGACSIDGAKDDTSVALVTKPGTRGICGPRHCLIPLDADSDYGWQLEGSKIRMPKAVCERLQKDGNVVAIATTTGCAQKTEALPTCGPWSTVGGQRLTLDAGLPENVSIPDAGSMPFVDGGGGGSASMPDASMEGGAGMMTGAGGAAAGGNAGMTGAGGAVAGTGGAVAGTGGAVVTLDAGGDASMDGGGGAPGVDGSLDGGVALDGNIPSTDGAVALDAGMSTDSGMGGCGGEFEPCCADQVCGQDLTCAGTACTCAKSVFGNMLVRADGRLLQVSGTTQTAIRDQTTGDSLTNVTSARRAHWHGCASRSDGSVWCWPSDAQSGNNNGELGNGTTGGTLTLNYATPVEVNPGDAGGPVYLDGVTSLQTGFSGYLSGPMCAIRTDRTIWCWGDDRGFFQNSPAKDEPYAKPIQSSQGVLVTDAVEVAVGNRHACYRDTGGGVHCWGLNIGGCLGNGTQNTQNYPVQPIGLASGVSKVVAGPDVTCALIGTGTDAGRVRCFGSTGAGAVGIGPPSADTDGCINYCKTAPARVRVDAVNYLEGIVDIVGGYQTNCGLKSDGTLWCWGALTGTDYAVEVMPQAVSLPLVSDFTLYRDDLTFIAEDGSYNVATSQLRAYPVNCAALD